MALLELDGLTKRYGGLIAVDNVTMRVEAGEVRAVIGPNGAGKTSLFHLITGLSDDSRRNRSFRRAVDCRPVVHISAARPACREPSS